MSKYPYFIILPASEGGNAQFWQVNNRSDEMKAISEMADSSTWKASEGEYLIVSQTIVKRLELND
jgi:hypothetical protein